MFEIEYTSYSDLHFAAAAFLVLGIFMAYVSVISKDTPIFPFALSGTAGCVIAVLITIAVTSNHIVIVTTDQNYTYMTTELLPDGLSLRYMEPSNDGQFATKACELGVGMVFRVLEVAQEEDFAVIQQAVGSASSCPQDTPLLIAKNELGIIVGASAQISPVEADAVKRAAQNIR